MADLAEARIREALSRVPDGTYDAQETLDDGSPLCVRVEVNGDAACVDFAGSAAVQHLRGVSVRLWTGRRGTAKGIFCAPVAQPG